MAQRTGRVWRPCRRDVARGEAPARVRLTLAPDGREQGLRYGANVIMPQATPLKYRRDYALYDGKPCLDDSAGQCASCLESRITSVGRRILRDAWGDPAALRPPG